MMKRKKLKKDDLDTETTFANMNVEGFRWYRPEKKDRMPQLTKEESRAMFRGAFAAMAPALIGAVVILILLLGLAYIWLS